MMDLNNQYLIKHMYQLLTTNNTYINIFDFTYINFIHNIIISFYFIYNYQLKSLLFI